MRDRSTGVEEDCGAIVKKRAVGPHDTWLTYDEPGGWWWIVIKTPGTEAVRKIGYAEERREVAWEAFLGLSEEAIDRQLAKPATASRPVGRLPS